MHQPSKGYQMNMQVPDLSDFGDYIVKFLQFRSLLSIDKRNAERMENHKFTASFIFENIRTFHLVG